MCSITQEREKETESVWGVCVCVYVSGGCYCYEQNSM